MLITNRNVQDLLRSYLQRAERMVQAEKPREDAAPTEPQAAPRTDAVELSSEAQEVQRALSLLKDTPEVREELVAELRQRIQEGSYKVDAEEIAELLLSEEDEG